MPIHSSDLINITEERLIALINEDDDLLSPLIYDVDSDAIEDAICLTLNKLPSKFIRHRTDYSFYSTSEDLNLFDRKILKIFNNALIYVINNPN